ncbi:phage holin family protein [Geodermatophilus ruber]|uniref:Putative Holin-X, holin superfamily III n=1 Tax=Geodermatophilus ruber TaxID=504800 RepID=A0A1I4DVL8_9ACTN|nr:phage holin family protein [Geodermatophilus ruber]SFK96116.1 Putative Holin-X, holin superfamily III [Geodermatophilus ruber]
MSTPYSGSTPVGTPQGYGDPTQANYAVSPEQAQAYGAHSGAMGTPTTEEGRPDVENASVGELMGEVAKDLSTLMRQELDLAKAEIRAEAGKAGKGAGLMGAAGFAGYMALLFLSIALWWALSHLVGHSWSALIVAVIWGVIGAVSYAMGRKQFQQVNPKPERTVDTLQQVPDALKPR